MYFLEFNIQLCHCVWSFIISGVIDNYSRTNSQSRCNGFLEIFVRTHHVPQAAFSSLVAEEELEFEDNIKFRSTLKDTEVFDPIVEEDSRLSKNTTELGSGEEKMEAEHREGKPKDMSPP